MNKKTGFFKSFWYAITNFEKYKEFAFNNSLDVFKYVVILLLLFSIIITFSLVVPIINTFNNSMDYFKNEFPDLTYSEGKLTVDSEEPIYLEDKDLDAVVIVDTNVTEEEKAKYIEEQKVHATSILIFSDELVVKTTALTSYSIYEYTQLDDSLGVDTFNKQDILNNFTGNQTYKVYISIYLFLFVLILLTYTVMLFIDIVILSILAFIISKIYKVSLRYSNCIKISVYALTLPLLLQLIYVYVNTFTGFTIEYFAIMYDIISYIYVITAILIIKNDLAKQDIGAIGEVKIEKIDDSDEIITNDEVEKQKEEKKKKEEEKKKNKENPGAEPNNA